MPRCSSCGYDAAEPFTFCARCGAAAAAPTTLERKRVTVLFCDVVASTELGERLDPETFHKVLGRYFQIAQDVIERHGGTVEKFFVGDRSDVPGDFESFLDGQLSDDEVTSLISVKAKLDKAGIAIGPPPERARYVAGPVL